MITKKKKKTSPTLNPAPARDTNYIPYDSAPDFGLTFYDASPSSSEPSGGSDYSGGGGDFGGGGSSGDY